MRNTETKVQQACQDKFHYECELFWINKKAGVTAKVLPVNGDLPYLCTPYLILKRKEQTCLEKWYIDKEAELLKKKAMQDGDVIMRDYFKEHLPPSLAIVGQACFIDSKFFTEKDMIITHAATIVQVWSTL